MDGVRSFYLLIVLILAVWALIRTFSVEAALRERIRALERLLQGGSAASRPLRTEAATRTEAVPAPATPTETPRQDQHPASAAVNQASRPAPASPPSKSGTGTWQPAIRDFFKWLTGGNIFVRIGVLVLFFGVAFLLKYASEHHALPPELRLAGASALAVALLIVGWRLRTRMPAYALVLQGGGIGVLYLAIFASLRLYHLLPGGTVFLLLCLVVVFGMTLAVLQDSISLAVMSVLGGFLAPVLASTGGGSHVVLFSYYLVLNAGVLGVAFHRPWRVLNVLGFVCTFIIGTGWGALKYQPELFASTEPFLILFFLMYTGIALLYALRQSVRLAHYADGALIFGVPLVGFGLQSAMVHNWHFGVAFSALALAFFYISLAMVIHRLRREGLRMLSEAFLALGVGFATLAIPFALDAYWTSAAWALEGAGVAWTGMRQGRRLPLLTGLSLQIAGGIAFVTQAGDAGATLFPVINSQTLGVLMIAVAALFSAWYLDRRASAAPASHSYPQLSVLMFCWGMLWWVYGGMHEAERLTPGDPVAHLDALLTFATASLLLFSSVARPLRWNLLGLSAALQVPVMLIASLFTLVMVLHPLQAWGWLAWPPALAVSVLLLYHLEGGRETAELTDLWHTLGLLISVGIITWECDWRLQLPHDPIWRLPLKGMLPALTLLTLATGARRWLPWPVDRHAKAYTGWSAAGLALFLWFWLIGANLHADSSGAMLSYIPLLNPFDLTGFLVLLGFGYWFLAIRRGETGFGSGTLAVAYGMAGIAAFVWVNGMLIRSLCYWLGLRFAWDPLYDSQIVQMSLSVLWTACALALMVPAARRGWRAVWFAGAILMALEVIKLFSVDLASAGSIERIVSFIVVGGLLLLMGYFSPLPPAARKQKEQP